MQAGNHSACVNVRLWFSVVLACCLPACTAGRKKDPVITPELARVTTPPRSQPVDVRPVDESLGNLEEARRRAEDRARKAEATLGQTKSDLVKARENADKAFRNGVQAGSEEAEQLKADVDKLSTSLDMAETEVKELRKDLQVQQAEVSVARAELATVREASDRQRVEVEQLRARDTQLVAAMGDMDARRRDAEDLLKESEKRVAALKPYRLGVWVGGVVLLCALVLWVIIKVKVL